MNNTNDTKEEPTPPDIVLPEELLSELKSFCEEKSLGFGYLIYGDIQVIVMGKRGLGPIAPPVIAANMLLSSVINGLFSAAAELENQEDESESLRKLKVDGKLM